MRQIVISYTPRVVQRPREDSRDLHERLRSSVTGNIIPVRELTQLVTSSDYTFDTSKILVDLPNSVAVCTSHCKHELPLEIYVGIRTGNWKIRHPSLPDKWIYTLGDIEERALTDSERNAIYDNMP